MGNTREDLGMSNGIIAGIDEEGRRSFPPEKSLYYGVRVEGSAGRGDSGAEFGGQADAVTMPGAGGGDRRVVQKKGIAEGMIEIRTDESGARSIADERIVLARGRLEKLL